MHNELRGKRRLVLRPVIHCHAFVSRLSGNLPRQQNIQFIKVADTIFSLSAIFQLCLDDMADVTQCQWHNGHD